MEPPQHLSRGTEKTKRYKKTSLRMASESAEAPNRHIQTIRIVYYLYIDMFGLQLHLKSQSETITQSCRWSHRVCSLDIAEIGTWHHCTTLVSLVKFLHTDAMVCGAEAIDLYPLHRELSHKLTQQFSWKSKPARESTNSHLQSVLCNLLYDRAGVGNRLLQLSDMFGTLLTNHWKLLKVLVYKLPILCTSMISFSSSSVRLLLKLTDYCWFGPQKC